MSRSPELLELLLSPLSSPPHHFKVTVTQSPAGEGSADSCLPFVEADHDWRSTLLRALELASFQPEYFTPAEQDWLVKAHLLSANRQAFHPQLRQTIGQELYRALIPPNSKVERLLNESIQIARTRGVQLLVQLKFEADGVQVARLPDYPWELLHDESGFLLHNQVGFSRYIAFGAVPPRLPVVEQVKVLLISSGAADRALGFNPLPKRERAAIAEALKAAIGAQRIRLEELSEPTLDGLAAYLTQHQGQDAPHLLHFDGHGLFGKRCSECRRMHKGIKSQQCQSCHAPLPEAQGYLLFEDEYGDPDYVSASQLGTLLQQTRQSDGRQQTGGVAALVLSACQSGMAVAGETVFQGTAQNLIYHGVPAVIAMQYSVTVEGAIAFAKQFYRSIGEKNSLAVAVSQGRAMMRVDENQWYRPVLYLRWRDNEGGQLFAPSAANPTGVLDTQTVEPYLRSLIANEKYQQKWGFYTPTDAIGKLQESKAASELDIELMVQLMQPKQSEDERSLEPQEKTERLPVLEGIRKYAAEHVLLMGRPGSGKSTALLRLLVDEARKALEDASATVPVLVELRYLEAEYPSVLERIGAFLRSHDLHMKEATLKTALTEGRFLLLIDGVNELPSEAARRAVTRFRQDYPKTPMVFTTRDVAIGGDVGIEKKLEMQPLTEQQMRQFVNQYLPDQREPMLRQLQGRLREIGQTPLLLWMLCQVFHGLKQLPSSLGLLFRWFAGEYDRLKQDVPVSEGLRYWRSELLRHLAFTMMQGEPEAEPPHPLSPPPALVAIPRQQAETILAEFLRGKVDYPAQRAKEWLEDLLEHHLLQCNSQNKLEFHHQLFQEYYAAEALLHRLPYLSDEQLKRDYLNYLKWTEPIALMLTLEDQKTQALRLVESALNVDLTLGAKLAGAVKQTLHRQTVEQVVNHMDALKVSEWVRVEVLGRTRSQKAVPMLLQMLESQNANVCRRAVEWLGVFGNQAAIEALRTKLVNLENVFQQQSGYSDEDFLLWSIVAEALCKLSDQQTILALRSKALSALTRPLGFFIFPGVEELLGQFDKEAFLPELFKALEDQNCRVCRENAALMLGHIGNEVAVPKLIKALDDPYLSVRKHVLNALVNFQTKESFQALITAMEDPDDTVRANIAKALAQANEQATVPGLCELLNCGDWNISWRAAEVLGHLGNDKSLPKLCEGLRKDHPDIRRVSAEALILLKSQQTILELSSVLKRDPDYSVRRSAAIVLGQFGDKTAIPELLKALRHYYLPSNLRAGVEALITLNDYEYERVHHGISEEEVEKLGDEWAIWRWLSEHRNITIRIKVAKALGRIGTTEAIRGLLEALKDPNASARLAAAIALAELNIKETISDVTLKLFENLKYSDSDIRKEIVAALVKLGNEQVVSKFIELLKDEALDRDIRWSIVDALGQLDTEITAKHLTDLTTLLPKPIGQQALWSIFRIQNRCKYYNHEIAHGLLPPGKSIALYFSYASQDEDLRNELAKHLNLLERQGVITSWNNRQILPGDEPAQVISDRLNTVDIILLLISPDSLADDTCYDVEIRRAMERHRAGEARVIPILLRPVDWSGALFSQLPVLPQNRQPVTTWENRDEAFQAITAGIREAAIELRRTKQG